MRLFGVVFLLSLSLTVFSQNDQVLTISEAFQFFKEVSEQYESGLSFHTRMRSYAGEVSTVVQDEFVGEAEVSGKSSYMELPGCSVYSSDAWIAQVMDDEKRIYVSNASSNSANFNFEKQYNEFLSNASSITLKTTTNGCKNVTLNLNEPCQYERVEYELDAMGRLAKMTTISRLQAPLNWEEDSDQVFKCRIVLDYFNYKKLEQTIHVLSDLIYSENGIWRGKGIYKDYEIIELKRY